MKAFKCGKIKIGFVLSILSILSILLLVSGCGGGGGGGGAAAQTQTVTGVAAAGAPISGNVTIEDSSATPKTLTKAIAADGSYSFDVTGWTKPLMLKAVGTAAGNSYTLYSLTGDAASAGLAQMTANINPMSNLVVANAAVSAGKGANLETVYNNFAAMGQAVSGSLPQSVLEVQATLKTLLPTYVATIAAANPISDSYTANHTGLDLMFDSVRISVDSANSGTASITTAGGTPISSLPLATGFATYPVSGQVTLSGAGLSGVTVTVADAGNGSVYGSPTTGANGSYSVAGVPQRAITVTPVRSGYLFDRVKSSVTVAAAVTVPDFLASVIPTYPVSGRVTLSGAGFSGVTVTVTGAGNGTVYGSATTGNDGSYTVPGLYQGSYTVTVARTGYMFDRASSTVTVAAAVTVPDFMASVMPAARTVSGRVTDANQAGIAGVTVTASQTGMNPVSAVTDGSGHYSIAGLPNGAYLITPTRNDVYAGTPIVFDVASRSVTINNNYALSDFSASGLTTYTVSGKVTSVSGAALSGVKMTLAVALFSGDLQHLRTYTGSLTSAEASLVAYTDATGNYTISGIPTCYFTLTPTLTNSTFGILGVQDALTADKGIDFTALATNSNTGGVTIRF